MKTFNQFLIESNIVLDKKFIKNVEDFVFKNDKKYVANIAKHKGTIPPMFKAANTLYRGMTLTEKLFKEIKGGKKLKLDDYSSWTSDKKVAISFVNDASKKISSKSGGVKVIFKKKMSKEIILDIFSYILFLDMNGKLDEFEFDETTRDSAVKEKEFICDKNINLVNKDIDEIIK